MHPPSLVSFSSNALITQIILPSLRILDAATKKSTTNLHVKNQQPPPVPQPPVPQPPVPQQPVHYDFMAGVQSFVVEAERAKAVRAETLYKDQSKSTILSQLYYFLVEPSSSYTHKSTFFSTDRSRLR